MDKADRLKKVVKPKERYICQMLRLDGFDKNGNIDFSINVPMNANLFDTLDKAIDFGNKNIGNVLVDVGFWGAEYNNADMVTIYCGFIVFSTFDMEYRTYNLLPNDRRVCYKKFCNPSLLIQLQEAYKNGGQIEMFKFAILYTK